ncbi:hypothetical protein EMPS_04865 [Entomortierella parvispora]|uniref:Uncharacterized protein n=1 Tax=Entomortierella parvispora TaxID=205924 RepID=A0A9P3H9E6_9FUNG|nr:hypothetical protein EMPS_04865 [Entomortierella parvispora]
MLFPSKSVILPVASLVALISVAQALPQVKRDDVQAFKDAIICDANCYAAELRQETAGGTAESREQDARQMLTCAGEVTSMFNTKEEVKTNFGFCVQASMSRLADANRVTLQEQHSECVSGCY